MEENRQVKIRYFLEELLFWKQKKKTEDPEVSTDWESEEGSMVRHKLKPRNKEVVVMVRAKKK